MAEFLESSVETEPLLQKAVEDPSINTEDDDNRRETRQQPRFIFENQDTFWIPVPEENPILDNPTTIALDRCKRLVMRPYFILLKMIGWQPLFDNPTRIFHLVMNILPPIFVILLIIFDDVVEVAACFRRDSADTHSGSIDTTATGCQITNTSTQVTSSECSLRSIISEFIIPDVTHFCAYFYYMIVFRVLKCEQLPTLMQWVFLQTSPTQGGYLSQGRLIRNLRILFWTSVTWPVINQIPVLIHIITKDIKGGIIFHYFLHARNKCEHIVLLALLDVNFLVFDLVYLAVVLNYCVRCVLLLSYIHGLKENIREHTKRLEEIMKDIVKMEVHLKDLNLHPGLAVSFVINILGTMVVSGFLAIVKEREKHWKSPMFITTGVFIFMWLVAIALPVILAAKLTAACSSLRQVGREILTRPFGYQDESQEELDSFHSFTSSLRLKAKMFLVPIEWSYVCGVFFIMWGILMLLYQSGTLTP